MSSKKTAAKKTNTKTAKRAAPAKPKIKTVEETPKGLVEVKASQPVVKEKKAKATKEPKEKKVSAIDAAAKVLAASKEPLSAKQMIEAMTTKGFWTSPGGKTPHATLYSAILREITTKGKEARFTKTERGRFAINA